MNTQVLVMSGIVIATALSTRADAAAVPLTTTQLVVTCTGPSALPGQVIGPLPAGLSLACDLSESFGRTVKGDPIEYAMVGAIDTGLGAGSHGAEHTVGTVKADLELHTSGVKNVTASMGGIVSFYYAVDQIRAPGTVSSKIPVYFHAQGEGSSTVDGSASATFSAFVQGVGDGFPYSLFQLGGSGSASDSFNQRTTLWFAPGTYGGSIGAGCGLIGEGSVDGEGHAVTGSASCNVAIDPTLGFDQAAFDLAMGANTFRLDDYYRLSLSPNLPVPEPQTVALMLAGLGVLRFVNRRRQVWAV